MINYLSFWFFIFFYFLWRVFCSTWIGKGDIVTPIVDSRDITKLKTLEEGTLQKTDGSGYPKKKKNC